MPTQTLQYNNAFILPYLNYCNIIWGSAPKSVLAPLEVLQKKALKIALNMPIRTLSDTVFKESKVLTLANIHKLHVSIFMFKYKNDLLPKSFTNKFSLNSAKLSYSTRTAQQYALPKFATNQFKQSLYYEGPTIFNALPNSFESSNTLSIF